MFLIYNKPYNLQTNKHVDEIQQLAMQYWKTDITTLVHHHF